MSSFDECWEKGERAVKAVIAILHALGYWSARLDLIDEGGAPSLRTVNGRITVPDLQCVKSGLPFWLEVKYKTRPGYHRLRRAHTHGVDLINLRHYRDCQTRTGLACALVIYESNDQPVPETPEFQPGLVIHGQWLDGLELHSVGHGNNREPEQFFTRACLTDLPGLLGRHPLHQTTLRWEG